MPRALKVPLIVFAVFLAFLAGLYAGGHYYRLSLLFVFMPDSVRSAIFPGDDLLRVIREVDNILEEGYYQPVDRQTLEDGALEGVVGSLGDPYSAYLSPEEYSLFQNHTNGVFVGVGVIIESREGRLTVVKPVEGSPAREAGIQPGDVIVAVDGVSIENRLPEEATALIRGEEGTEVVLTIRRGESDIDFRLTRKTLELPIVSEEMLERGGKKIGYIRLEQFALDAGVKVRASMDRLEAEGAEGIIFDLRNNGGGILDEAVTVSSVFIENGPIVSVVSRSGETDVYEARDDANESMPLVVLINGYSASASEIVAGAVKDDGRGLLVGEKTFGKGLVQSINPLSNGGAIKFTSGAYYTPLGININEIGIEPNIAVADDPATPADEVLDRGLAALAS